MGTQREEKTWVGEAFKFWNRRRRTGSQKIEIYVWNKIQMNYECGGVMPFLKWKNEIMKWYVKFSVMFEYLIGCDNFFNVLVTREILLSFLQEFSPLYKVYASILPNYVSQALCVLHAFLVCYLHIKFPQVSLIWRLEWQVHVVSVLHSNLL